ncbi:MAG: hypothetical protein ACRCX8_05455 [Sarcina sp.]
MNYQDELNKYVGPFGFREIDVFYDEGYYVTVKTRYHQAMTFVLDKEGIDIFIENVQTFHISNGNIVVKTNECETLKLEHMLMIYALNDRHIRSCCLKVESKIKNYRLNNIEMHYFNKVPDSIFIETENMKPIKSIEGGYTRRLFKHKDYYILEFINRRNRVQVKLDPDIEEILPITEIGISYRPNRSEWRVIVNTRVEPLSGEIINYHGYPLARVIMQCPVDLVTDHISRNTLDNRRINLRNVTVSTNMHNRNKVSSTSIIKGVSVSKIGSRKVVEASIDVNRIRHRKVYSVNKYGLKKAIEMATEKRREWNKKFNVEEE